MLKKVLLFALVILFMLLFSNLFAQSNSDGKDPDDMRSYSEVKKEGTTKRTVIIDGKVVIPQKNNAKLTLREQKKLAEITKLRIKQEKKSITAKKNYRRSYDARLKDPSKSNKQQ